MAAGRLSALPHCQATAAAARRPFLPRPRRHGAAGRQGGAPGRPEPAEVGEQLRAEGGEPRDPGPAGRGERRGEARLAGSAAAPPGAQQSPRL